MKKSLVALAVLAASGAAMAQSSVTLYGIADIWLGRVDNGTTTTTQLESGGVSTSRWGMKGSEDLGGGLKANYKLEAAVGLDTGASTGFSRESWVGLSGGFGEVRLGKVSSAFNDIEGAAGPVFGSGPFGPMGLAFESDFQETGRPTNTIYYAAPSMGGFNAAVSYSLDEKALAGSEVVSLGLSYEAGPLYVSAGYQSEQATTAGAQKIGITQVNATYDLGSVKLLAALGNVKNSYGVAGDDVSEWLVGVDVPVSSALTLSAGYASSTRSFAPGVADDKKTAFSIGAGYSLSKRTTVYVVAQSNKLDSVVDVSGNGFAVGVTHKF